jgi:glutaredoxin
MTEQTKKETGKVIVYSNTTCPYCKEVKEKLTKKEIEFENRSTADFQKEWHNVISLTGMAQVPTIFYKDTYLVPGRDYGNADGLMMMLENLKGITESISLEQGTLERIKTLTYHMQTAFGRMDQLLRKIENKLNTEEDVNKSTD